MNAEIARSVVDRFPQMIEAAATLLRAADGALPAAAGLDRPAAPRPALDLGAVVSQLVPFVLARLGKNKPVANAVRMKPIETVDVVPENATDVLPPIEPQMMTHFIAVQSGLAPDEAAIAREVVRELSAAELRAWFEELSRLSVLDAVAKVRKHISGHGKNGPASS
jgi:hypothetical protein